MSTPPDLPPAAAPSPAPAPASTVVAKSSNWRPWLAAALIFVVGFGAGAVCSVALGIHVVRKRMTQPPPPNVPGLMADRQVDRIANDVERELKLTPEESARVREELNRTAANLRQIRARVLRDVQKEFRESVVRIALTLPQDKRKEFRELVRERFKRAGLRQPDEADAPTPAPEAGK